MCIEPQLVGDDIVGSSLPERRGLPQRRLFAFRGLQNLDHCRGSDDSCRSVVFEGQEFFVAGDEEISMAGFCQREEKTAFGVRSDNLVRQVGAKLREIPQACRQQFDRTHAKSGLEKGAAGNVSQLRNERLAGYNDELLSFPRLQQLGRRANRRQQR